MSSSDQCFLMHAMFESKSDERNLKFFVRKCQGKLSVWRKMKENMK